jgi:trk system potassium uptake protein TrkH
MVLAAILTGQFLWESVRQFRRSVGFRTVLRARFLELALTAAAFALLASQVFVWAQFLPDPAARQTLEPVYRQYAVTFLVAAGLRLVVGEFPVRRLLHRLELRPAQTVAVGFACAILAGTLLLSLPPAVTSLETVSMLNALFTATSSVTVTGLTVYNIGTFHTPLGQAIILCLIQLGGLGTMAASASLVILAGRGLRLRTAAALQESMDLQTVGEVTDQIRTIVLTTLVAEGVGTVFLFLGWRDHPAVGSAFFAAAFHSVSAFCNAGFSIFSENLLLFRDHLPTNAIVCGLIILGGLGFPVIREVQTMASQWIRGQRVVISLHTRLALLSTGLLLVAGAGAVFLVESGGVLAGLPWFSRLPSAVFQSVTARTAGFNTLDVGAMQPATLWLLMLLMFVGGCPGSTAGGIKTTTAAAMAAALWATLTGRDRVEAFRRTIPAEQVAKALAVVGVSMAVIAAVTLGLLSTEFDSPLALTFEAVSAFGTVGLSTGVTAGLSEWGKLFVMGAMFVGRIGPLTLGFALAVRERRSRVAYPAEKIMVG